MIFILEIKWSFQENTFNTNLLNQEILIVTRSLTFESVKILKGIFAF